MNKIKVVQIVPLLSPGGAERVAVHIARGLNRRRYEPLVISFSGRVGCDLDYMLEAAGIETFLVGENVNQLIPSAFRVWLQVRVEDEEAALELLEPMNGEDKDE